MTFTLEEATIAGFHAALEQGITTCEDVVRAYIQKIEKYDQGAEGLNAVIAINPRAIQDAKRLDQAFRSGGLTGPLHGVPVLLKDNCETEDMPTTAGSKSLENWCSDRDAFLTARLRKAGAIILAKANLHEFAVWGETVSSILGQSRNPYDLTRTPGGSSGGTGAGIAANFAMVGIGTDTINSIRSPSSACSLCGIRPTIGLVSRTGVVPYSMTQDTAGPIARTVEDAARVLEVIAGYDPEDPVTRECESRLPDSYRQFLKPDGLKGKRIGVLENLFGKEAVHSEVNRVIRAALAKAESAGAVLVPLDEPFDTGVLVSEVSVHLHELKTHLGEYLSSFGDRVPVHSIDEILASGKYTPDIEDNLKTANTLGVGVGDYSQRLKKRVELQQQVLALMERHQLDAIAYPHQQQLVCKTGGSQQQRNGVIGSVTGYPAMVVPGGFSTPDENAPIGVPVGLELLGRPFDEGRLLEIACGFESNFPLRVAPGAGSRYNGL